MLKLVTAFRSVSDVNPIIFSNPKALFPVASVVKPTALSLILMPKHLKISVLMVVVDVAPEKSCSTEVLFETPVELIPGQNVTDSQIVVLGFTMSYQCF